MVFLLLRFLPLILPVVFFLSAKAVFYYNDQWQWFLALILILPILYFWLLKIKNRAKPVFLLLSFSLIFSATGFIYSLILENQIIINLYLIVWSLFLGLYLEAVFHDFYDTAKSAVLNLSNIILYGNILVIFFITASLISFSIFLNFPTYAVIACLAIVYFLLLILVFSRRKTSQNDILTFSAIISLILVEILGAGMFLPVSFYVIAVIITLCYYLLISLASLSLGKQLTNQLLWRYLAFGGVIILIILATATWL